MSPQRMSANFPLRPYVAGGWMVQLADREAGPYFSRGLAIRVAIDEAWVASCARKRAEARKPADTRAKDNVERPAINTWQIRTRLRSNRFGF